MKRAIFIDKDGTLVHDVPYNVDPERISFLPGVFESLRKLQKAGYDLFIISNQAGIGRGLFSEENLQIAFSFITDKLLAEGVRITKIYYCPHTPDDKPACECRKPLPGMLLKAAGEYDIDLKRSWMVGDILHDVEAGNRAGCTSVLLNTGNETEWLRNEYRYPDFVVENWPQIQQVILKKAGLCHINSQI